jgi:hypothetical protein
VIWNGTDFVCVGFSGNTAEISAYLKIRELLEIGSKYRWLKEDKK